MISKNVKRLIKAFALLSIFLGANSAFALTLNQVATCQYITLVPNILNQTATGTSTTNDLLSPSANTTVCVDIPNKELATGGNKIVWDMDTPVTTDGLPNTTPAGIRHMWMMANAMEYMIQSVLKKSSGATNLTSTVHIYGVLHGTALDWALSDAWWEAQVDQYGNQLYPNGNPIGPWIQKIQAFAAKYGLDMHLEVCGVTLMGAGLSSSDVYPGILVNGGAFGRFAVLHNEGFLVIQEGWIDNDTMYMKKFMSND